MHDAAHVQFHLHACKELEHDAASEAAQPVRAAGRGGEERKMDLTPGNRCPINISP